MPFVISFQRLPQTLGDDCRESTLGYGIVQANVGLKNGTEGVNKCFAPNFRKGRTLRLPERKENKPFERNRFPFEAWLRHDAWSPPLLFQPHVNKPLFKRASLDPTPKDLDTRAFASVWQRRAHR